MNTPVRPRSLLSRIGLLAGVLAAAAPVTVVQGTRSPRLRLVHHHGRSRQTKPRFDRAKRDKRNRMARLSRRINRANGSYRRAST